MKTIVRAAIYARISSDQTGLGLGVTRQVEDCKRLATERGWTVADEYIDNDVVYGVKAPLVVEFVKKPPGKAPNGEMVDVPFYEVKYDFVLEQKQAALAAAE